MSAKEKEEKQTEFEVKNKNLLDGEPLKELSAKEAYFASLNEWVKHANISHTAMTMFPWYFMASYPQLFTQPAPGNLMPTMGLPISTQNPAQPPAAPVNFPANGFGFRPMNNQAQAELINHHGGYEYVLAPFWKRAVAEFIDMIIMLFFKIKVLFIFTNILRYEIDLNVNESVLNKALDSEDFAGALLYYMDFLTFSDVLAFEIFTKLLVCLYEAECTAFINGASIGKYIMGLSIKHVEAMVVLPNNNDLPAQPIPQIQLGFQTVRVQIRALLYPAVTPNFKRAFARAVAKNFILSVLFPIFFLTVFFKNNRTAYDILTKTIVVEASGEPVRLRRPEQQQQQQ